MATAEAIPGATFVPDVLRRGDHRIIGEIIDDKSSVLDLGCGEGDLLAWLEERKSVKARGVEISPEKVRRCVEQGLSVYQGDLSQGLADYPDKCFDYVILSQTLQVVSEPLNVLYEMLRVGRQAIVAFPNFGHWSVRLSLLWSGRAPRTKHLPYEWYNSPNIHVLTVTDFEQMVDEQGITVDKAFFVRGGRQVRVVPNLRADSAVYLLRG
jgi:methionine biosynthesis protein MetW